MAAKKRASRKRARIINWKKVRFIRSKKPIEITPIQKQNVIDAINVLQNEAEDIALKIDDLRELLCYVDFCGHS